MTVKVWGYRQEIASAWCVLKGVLSVSGACDAKTGRDDGFGDDDGV